ncbi:hypothetical protein PINS_up014177 [Pythium insidiosum]|nr:hypothetical protein PINS_up014177 [Pythium insidiosum]
MRSDTSSRGSSSSDDDVSLQEEKWDDLAIVRAFEDALTEKRTKAQHASQRPQNVGKTKAKAKAARTKSERKRSTASEAAPQEPVPVHQGAFASQEELYQAAYAQAYAHLQQQHQQQQQQQQHHQQMHPAPSGYAPFGHTSMPQPMAAPSAYPSSFWQSGSTRRGRLQLECRACGHLQYQPVVPAMMISPVCCWPGISRATTRDGTKPCKR